MDMTDNYIIVDLEATCWEGDKSQRNEIIEIGAVCIRHADGELTSAGEFCEFVKPMLNPTLSDFCTQLTSITQSQVDSADPFPVVLKQFLNWINHFSGDYLIGSWGHYDRVQFMRDCDLHQLDDNWVYSHISLKHQYAQIKHHKRPVGMKRALKNEALSLEGTHHRGIDDARNLSKIFKRYFQHWKLHETYRQKIA